MRLVMIDLPRNSTNDTKTTVARCWLVTGVVLNTDIDS